MPVWIREEVQALSRKDRLTLARKPGCIDVVAGILHQEGRILIARRSCEEHRGEWEFPGGKIEPGESPVEALQRELDEELGIFVHQPSVLGAVLHNYPAKQVHIMFFAVSSWRGRICPHEGGAVRWVAPEELDVEILAAADQRFWRAVASRRYI